MPTSIRWTREIEQKLEELNRLARVGERQETMAETVRRATLKGVDVLLTEDRQRERPIALPLNPQNDPFSGFVYLEEGRSIILSTPTTSFFDFIPWDLVYEPIELSGSHPTVTRAWDEAGRDLLMVLAGRTHSLLEWLGPSHAAPDRRPYLLRGQPVRHPEKVRAAISQERGSVSFRAWLMVLPAQERLPR